MRVGNLIFCFLFVLGGNAFGQEKDAIIQQRIEFISEELETENLDLTNLVDVLNYYYEHPLNLNSASLEELHEMALLNEIQINNLLLHRQIHGKLISIYELQELEYWDLNSIKLVLPFVKVDDKLDQLHVGLKEALKQGKFEAYFRYQRIIEDKEGYADVPDSIKESSNSYYHGNPDRYYARFRYSYRTNLSVGVTAEKDPGEEFFEGSQKDGFDFYSAHAFYKGGKYLRSVALGDYQIQIGQGLNLWSGYAFGKSADATNIKKSPIALKPYTSVDEVRFLRGAAVELGVKKFALSMFGSYKGIDGSILFDTLSNEQLTSSISYSGLHRTNSEIGKKHALNEVIVGSNLKYESRVLSVGVAGIFQGYDQPYVKDTLPYNQFDFRGQNTVVLSADYNLVWRNFNFFGEVATSSHSGGFAQIYGVLMSLDKFASMSLAYRNYDRDFHSFYNAGFAESSKTQNEKGLYAGLKMNFKKGITVNGYIDLFKFPWMRYQVDAPSQGHEFLIQPSYKMGRNFELYLRFREQLKEKNSRESDGSITQLEDVLQRNYRVNLSYKVTESIRLKSRVEYVTIDRISSPSESGLIITQDVIFKPKSFPIDLALRYALFDTDSYDTRIYTYENNALYTFSIPAYYYQGSRAYALIRATLLRKIDLWVRYGVSIFANRSSLGSGAEEILGNTKSDLTIQLRVKI